MTTNEAAVLMAFTGIMMGDFSKFHEYAEKKLDRPIFTHEFGIKEIANEIKEASREDFMTIMKNITD